MKKNQLILLLFFIVRSACAQSPIVNSVLIFPAQPLHAHGSSLVLLPNGDYLAAWFLGKGERNADDVRIMGARLKKGDRQWSEPFLMADTPGLPDCNPVLFLNKKGKLFLVWIAVAANRWEFSILRYRTSTSFLSSGAPVWNWQDNILLNPDERFASEIATKFKEAPPQEKGWSAYAPPYDELIAEAAKDAGKRSIGWMTRIKPLITADGRIILPLYSDGFNLSLAAISDDDGNSWHCSLPIVGRGPIQPALAQRKDGTIVAYMRDSGDSPERVQVSESHDNGESWTFATKSAIPNTASVEICVMQNGRWAFLGNDITDGRYQLSLYISDDEGRSWKWKTRVEDDLTRKGSFCYPSLLQAPDGYLHMTYSYHKDGNGESIKYLVLDPEKVTQ